MLTWLKNLFKPPSYLENNDSWDLEMDTTPLEIPLEESPYKLPRHNYVVQEETRTIWGAWEYCFCCRDWQYQAADPQPMPDSFDTPPWCPPGHYILEEWNCPHPDLIQDFDGTEETCLWCGHVE